MQIIIFGKEGENPFSNVANFQDSIVHNLWVKYTDKKGNPFPNANSARIFQSENGVECYVRVMI